jgi:hypothetical protein
MVLARLWRLCKAGMILARPLPGIKVGIVFAG